MGEVVKILLRSDHSCKMAEVHVNGKLIMQGNYWDFRPGTHGITKYGDFTGREGLISNIVNYYSKRDPLQKFNIQRITYNWLNENTRFNERLS